MATALAAVALAVVTATLPGSQSAFTATVTNSQNLFTLASTRTCASEYARTTPAAYAVYPLTDPVGLLTAADTSGNNRTATYALTALLAHSTSNACVRDTDGSTTYDGTSTWLITPSSVVDPQSFTVEIWFRTTSARGMLVGFNRTRTVTTTAQDRHLYLDTGGHVVLGVDTASKTTIASPGAYTDGAWHQAVGTYSAATGLTLYVDGRQVAALAGSPAPTTATGWWRIGLGDLADWPGAGTNYYVKGQLGQVGIWGSALPATTIAQHYAAGT